MDSKKKKSKRLLIAAEVGCSILASINLNEVYKFLSTNNGHQDQSEGLWLGSSFLLLLLVQLRDELYYNTYEFQTDMKLRLHDTSFLKK